MDTLHDFRAMGTVIRVLAPAGHPASTRASRLIEARFVEEETRFSRFRGDSELSRINAGGGGEVSATFAAVLRLALDAAHDTGGLFDPTVHDALVAAGYERDFDEVLAGARGRLHAALPCGRWTDISMDGRTLTLPRGVHLDLGGIVKGWTADRAAEDAVEAGLPWVLVNAGGDLRLLGDAPDIEVGIEDPEAPDLSVARIRMSVGGLATSSVAKRTWATGEHHVIDPRTGRPATTDLLQATAWAPTCTEAEVRATSVLLAGRIGARANHTVLVARDGDVLVAFPQGAAA